MKKKFFILITVVLTIFYACVTFTEPQPANTANLSIFPKKLQGKYLSLADSSILLIEDKIITRICDTDSISATDTVFQMNYDNVVRKYKGYFFLNIRYDKNSWGVSKMHLAKKQLVISSISTKEEIQDLKELTETSQDSIYNFTVTKKQFGKYIKNGGFSDSEVFVKL
jgi:hypothetical protein